MSNEENPEQQRYGGWQPTPQSAEYDAEATAFVHLPPEDPANDPLAAPGQGYVPPMILPLTPAAGLDPAATGSWIVQTQSQQAQAQAPGGEQLPPEAVHWPDPNQQYQQTSSGTAGTTGQWNFAEATGTTADPHATATYDDQPGQPGHPGHAGQPGYSGGAGQPGPPGHPELPEHVGHPGRPGDPEQPGHPGYPGQPGHSEYAGQQGHPGQPERPDYMGRPGQPERPEHAGHPGQPERPDYMGHSGQPGDPEHAGQQGHPGYPGRPGHSEHVDHPGGPEHPERDILGEPVGHTGQWTIPVADGDLPEESGEFAASALSPQWHTDMPPATLPGGAPAPWATQPEPKAAQQPPPAEDDTHGATQATPEVLDGLDDPDVLDGPDTVDAPAPPDATPPLPPDPTGTPQGSDSAHDPAHTPAPETAPAPTHIDVPSEHAAASYVLHVNGVDRPVSDAWIGESLLYVLRERLGLAGAKDGCSQGECGACNVQVDGRLVASCLVPAATAAGSEVRTVEGLAVDGEPSDVQRALADCGAVQCGFCIPGMAMTVHDLLEGNHAPSELETRQALCGNLCRCSGYRGVLDAVREVVAGREASADTTATPDTDEARIPHQAAPGAGSVQAHLHEGDAR